MQRAEKYERKAARNSPRSMVALMREELYNTLDFEKFAEELGKLEGREYVEEFLKTLRFVLPAPVERESEADGGAAMTEFQKAVSAMVSGQSAPS